jgi:four helix bundle protein
VNVNVPVVVPDLSTRTDFRANERNRLPIRTDSRAVQLDHERLDVYHRALDFLVLANGVIESLPRGKSHLADQFARASLSVVLNIAEGTGRHTRLEKRRFYLTARGSANESAALLDVCFRLKLIEAGLHCNGKAIVVRIVAMLVRLARRCEERE